MAKQYHSKDCLENAAQKPAERAKPIIDNDVVLCYNRLDGDGHPDTQYRVSQTRPNPL